MGEEHVVTFTYERLPNFSYLCGCLGHIPKYCLRQSEIASVGLKSPRIMPKSLDIFGVFNKERQEIPPKQVHERNFESERVVESSLQVRGAYQSLLEGNLEFGLGNEDLTTTKESRQNLKKKNTLVVQEVVAASHNAVADETQICNLYLWRLTLLMFLSHSRERRGLIRFLKKG
ncbi:UNVERIFIED_CONTAM: hypothetical protein Sradi_4924100 [Sesamum radiatum]|uniref:Zinc knuckle CX2CX4HX4C domain-containing protein n=1 Tax=Sesamum radiatum TaxID=300843 RepID=A0AAW2MCU4_SESRA